MRHNIMLGQYLIAFRESFEAALIVSIILSYIIRAGRRSLARYVWYSTYLSMVASLAIGLILWLMYSVLPKTLQTLFESLAAFIAVGVLSSMIYWMAVKGKRVREELERQIEVTVTKGSIIGLASMAFIVVFREGLETVLFLTPFFINDAPTTIIGAVFGAISALTLSYCIFIAGVKIDLRSFFYFTSILLILIAGGLVGYGVHELIEYYREIGVNFGWLSEPAYALNISSSSLLHHKNLIGSILAVMFGYTVSAEWLRLIVHFSYLAAVFPSAILIYRKP
jgi:high-affinity iron transporter